MNKTLTQIVWATLLSASICVAPLSNVWAHGKHPKRAKRAQQCVAKGDARMAKSVSGHTVSYALARYRIENLTTHNDVKRAQNDLYQFLKWKLGNPTAVCATYIGNGYGHFERGYSDEAAAALLDFTLPREKGGHAEFHIPKPLLDLGLKVESQFVAPSAQALASVTGVPSAVWKQILGWYLKKKYKFASRLGINIPKKYDFPNKLVDLAIAARRNSPQLQRKLQRVINEASGQTSASKKPTSPLLRRLRR